MKKTRRL
jgi:hypothetical protein